MKTHLLKKGILGFVLVTLQLFPVWAVAQQGKQIKQATHKEDSVKYYISCGQKFMQERKMEEALKAYENARTFDSKNEEAILGQMNMNFGLGRVEEGLKVIDDWTRVDPGNVKAWKTMADYYGMTGKTEIAFHAIDKLISLQPDSASNWDTKAQLLLGTGHSKEALEASDKAIALNPKDGQARYLKAYALAGTGKYDEAMATCNQAIKLFPEDVEAYYTRACIYSRKGEKENALGDLQKAIEMNSAIKDRAKNDPDFIRLYANENFQKLTGMTKAEANEAALADSVCVIMDKNYKRMNYIPKISGSWKADRGYVHGQNLLGERNFYFEFKSDGTIEIKEPGRNYDVSGTWKIGENDNSMEWMMPDKNTSFKGKYDFLGPNLIISGEGFIGEFEHVCLRLKLK